MDAPYVALATATEVSKEDFDLPPLEAALARAGMEVRVLPWDDPDAQEAFAAARVCIIRSTWNYVHHLDAFLAWADRFQPKPSADVERFPSPARERIRLWNPPPVVRWNSHKGYLLQLEGQGIPVVPTRLIPRGTAARLADLVGGWPAAVIKPAVSAGSFGTVRSGPGTWADGEAHLEKMTAHRDMLVQRYVPSVEDYGERALVWIDGTFCHAVRKSPRFAGDQENVSIHAVPIAPDEAALAEQVLAHAPGPLLYARVDMVRDEQGRPRLMELELIEPSLFLDRYPPSADRLAASIAGRCSVQ
jgi:hypothetical protein